MEIHKTLPTLQEIQDVLNMSEEALNAAGNEVHKQLYLWYYDEYLTHTLPKEFWGDDIRFYNLLTDTINIGGKDRVLVTVSSEAFGLLMYENCREKWIEYVKFKEKHGKKAKIPTGKEPEAEKHLAKWSDGKEGQVKYGGWKDEAYDRYEKLKKDVKAWRKADEEAGKAGQELAKKLMREKHGKIGETPEEDKKSKGKRARKKKNHAPAVAKKHKLTVEDE